jgi:hypothetical protein
MNQIVIIFDKVYYEVDTLFYKNNNITYKIIESHDSYVRLITSGELVCYDNVTVILDNMLFDSLSKTGDPFNTDEHNNPNCFTGDEEKFFRNVSNFSMSFGKNTKVILYDNDIELFPNVLFKKLILQWLERNTNNYLISSRLRDFTHPQAITNLTYLPLIFSYFKLGFHKYPRLEYTRPRNTEYDFITFLGLCSKLDKIENRFNFLEGILKYHMGRLKHEKDSNSYVTYTNFGVNSKTNHHFTNLKLVSSVKVQLVFETFHPLSLMLEDHYFSEKTTKLFLQPHPYLLLIHGSALVELEKFGFKFPVKCFTYDDYVNNINTILDDVDGWVDKYSDSFYYNHTNFYKLLSSDDLPHHLFMKSVVVQ